MVLDVKDNIFWEGGAARVEAKGKGSDCVTGFNPYNCMIVQIFLNIPKTI